MERKTNIHQFTFHAVLEQASKIEKFALNEGGVLFDVKAKIKEKPELENVVMVHLTFYNCGVKVASRKMAEFILKALMHYK